MIVVKLVENEDELHQAFAVREEVYIVEQQIDRADEFDAFEDSSVHFVAVDGNVAIGAARYRLTTEGVKLERFAVMPSYRKMGVASRLMEAMLDHVKNNPSARGKKLYLNAQLSAMPLYEKFHFQPEGDRFLECDIEHQKMALTMD